MSFIIHSRYIKIWWFITLNSLKEQEMDTLRSSDMGPETEISNLQNAKQRLQKNMEATLRESTIASKCLDDLWNEMTVLGSNLGLQALAKEILEKKLSELDMWLVAQLRYLSNDRESNLVELHNLEPRNTSLREEMRILESEMEARMVDRKQKLWTCKCWKSFRRMQFASEIKCRTEEAKDGVTWALHSLGSWAKGFWIIFFLICPRK